uniref:CS domain-containing protein n=1 Tax=Strongyloides venezuelensis TaxID=75913 RepID=A0A0K0G0C7_STRVS
MENIGVTKDVLFKKEENGSITSLPKKLNITYKWNSNTNRQYVLSLSLNSPQTISSSVHLFDNKDDIESSKNFTLNYIDIHTKHSLF